MKTETNAMMLPGSPDDRGGMHPPRQSNTGEIALLFLVPRFCVTLVHFIRSRSKVSVRAEVDLTMRVALGHKSTVSSFTKIKARGGELRTGRACSFGPGSFISATRGRIEIGTDFAGGPNVTIVSGAFGFARFDVPLRDQTPREAQGVRIGDNVSVGAGSVILDGAVLSDNTIVMPNSLVTRRFPPNCLIQGNPARVLLERNV